MKFIQAGWDSYRTIVLPPHVSPVQLEETRQAFFSGAAILFKTIMKTLDPGTEATESDMAAMAAIDAELDAFGHELDRKLMIGGRPQ